MTDAIVTEHLTKHYRLRREGGRTLMERFLGQYSSGEEVTALRDVSFSVAAGQVVGVVGANVSWKSTLLELVAGHLPADCGAPRGAGGAVSALLEIGDGLPSQLLRPGIPSRTLGWR